MEPQPPHWSYYMTLEDDLVETERYAAICADNLPTHSVEYARLLLAAGSEVDVVAKTVCGQLDPIGEYRSIDHYRQCLVRQFPALPAIVISIPWHELQLRPWSSWGQAPPKNPNWWHAYNEVKHHRHLHFKKANLENAINAIAGLYCLILHLTEQKHYARPARFLRVESGL